MRTREEGVKESGNFADVINGSSLGWLTGVGVITIERPLHLTRPTLRCLMGISMRRPPIQPSAYPLPSQISKVFYEEHMTK